MAIEPKLRAPAATSRPAALWLFAVAAIILAMVVVGGATRVTGSGLSITKWRPVSGVIPPLTHGAWEHMFRLYKATPQYELLNRGMSLAQFQTIFWWEWSHRFLGRLLGVVFLVPFVVLAWRRILPRRLWGRCAVLFALGALQGAVGWWMVKSGLEDRTSVLPERLATHLGLALILFAAMIWTALEAWNGPSCTRASSRRWIWASGVFLAGVYVQCLLGSLVAGNHAGLVDADWPLMAGRWFPIDYWRGSAWGTFAHGPAAVQFNHRIGAYLLVAFAAALFVAALKARRLRPLATAVFVLVLAQASLGVATLWLTVPLPIALTHQFTAAILLAHATALHWRARRLDLVF